MSYDQELADAVRELSTLRTALARAEEQIKELKGEKEKARAALHAKFGFVRSKRDKTKCACAYCSRDVEALVEMCAEYEMDAYSTKAQIAEKDKEIERLKDERDDLQAAFNKGFETHRAAKESR